LKRLGCSYPPYLIENRIQYFELTVQIPANTDAEVVLPASVHATIYQNENSIKPILQNGTAIVHVGSGTYTFVVK